MIVVALTPDRRHELRLLAASRPALPLLLTLGRFARPIRRMPGLGWLVADPVTARLILNDGEHFSLLGEGGVGHLWAQVLGDWVHDAFDGAGHHALRTKARELFTEDNAAELVARVAGPRLRRCTEALNAGETVDVADLGRVIVGRIVADLLGLRIGTTDSPDDDAPYRAVFNTGEELAALALGSTASTHLPDATVRAAKAIVARMTGGVAAAWREAPPDTLLGRCRDLGLGLRETEGLAVLLTVAGTETAASAMARTVALLHDTGEQHRLRAEPDRIADAVREGLRVTTPAPVIGRSVRADVDVAGRRLRAGERVMMLTWTANNAPGGFDLARPYLPENRQLWFGAGRHLCLGAPVARAELTALLRALLATGRPWRIVERRYGRRVLIPTYHTLSIALA
ncbi:cytochrome P450 [Dactylosporangium sp. NPDC051485]|uniref:cytochrome P450 n=1 Tax=Dactylosporangium sp. NPDC051485 TaxID=3154846 RepID=UPI0034199407